MSFLPPATKNCTRLGVLYRSWLNTRRVRCMSRTSAEYITAKHDVPIDAHRELPLSFESLGLGAPFVQALHKAFPKVKTPTDIQAQLIPAILGTQDILLKDVTGSGKWVIFIFVFGCCSQIVPWIKVVWVDTWTCQ